MNRRSLLASAVSLVAVRVAFAQGGPGWMPSEDELAKRYGPKFTPSSDLAEWFENLKRPDIASGHPHSQDLISAISCCSAGDAYPIDILEDASPPHGGTVENGTARVTDPTARQILVPMHNPSGSTYNQLKFRDQITGPLTFHFSSDRVTREKDGNPTKTAWVFCRVLNHQIDYVYCVVPLPPSF